MKVERRSHPRFNVRTNAFAVLEADPVQIVPIVDVSLGGIAVYHPIGEQWPQSLTRLEIMVADCSFFMQKVPFEMAGTADVFQTHTIESIRKKRYGIKFGKLAAGQRKQIKHFIRHYAGNGLTHQIIDRFHKIINHHWSSKYAKDNCDIVWNNYQHPMM
jgi:hypothetical protein